MKDLRIEKNIPLSKSRKGERILKYPKHQELLENMEVGDSILFPLDNPKQRIQNNKEAANFWTNAINNYKYKMAQRKSSATCSVRFWRIK
tara:strand:- start:482 stop:751 length:270 start_codon:yes stop_codon:yes gene_type:complete